MSDLPTFSVTADKVRDALQQALSPVFIEVVDDSHLHAGHAGARSGRHFSVHVKGPCFAGMRPVQRHRLVYDALRELIPQGIHALAIKAEEL